MLILLCTCGVTQKVTHDQTEGYTGPTVPIETLLKRLRVQESNDSHKVRGKVVMSHRGAIGKYQITPIALAHFNIFSGSKKKYTTNSLRHEWINKMIGRWTFFNNLSNKSLQHYDLPDRMCLAINFFNMGAGNTWRGKIYYPYVSNICREYYPYFISRRIVFKQGTKVLHLWSLDPKIKDDL